MSRLVVVSNRVAMPGESRAGGLAVALEAALRERGGLWFGWSGKVVRGDSGELHERREGDIRYATMDLGRADHEAYYNGFANRTLWPLLHFRLDLVDYDRRTRAGYARVNALFAERLAPLLREDDTVWIHDYHLIPLARLLRERGIGCRMGCNDLFQGNAEAMNFIKVFPCCERVRDDRIVTILVIADEEIGSAPFTSGEQSERQRANRWVSDNRQDIDG